MRQIDPGAQQVLNQLEAAHHALFSFSAQVRAEAIGEKRRETATATVLYQKPSRARIEVKRVGGGSQRCVCDGVSRLTEGSGSRKKIKAEGGEKALLSTLSDASFFIAPVFLYLISRGAPISRLLPGTAKVIAFGNPTTLDGVPVEVVIAEVQAKQGTVRLTFSIGKDDRLLRRLMIQTDFQADNLTLSETYTSVKANPTLDKKLFTFPG